ncbi:MAG TPA: hypothetical protein PLL71_13695 [Agriterribacter sp.]|nr:hypothetical protein [Agriterribacter sp.]
MKYLPQHAVKMISLFALFAGVFVPKSFSGSYNDPATLNGAWHTAEGSIEQSLIIADSYCMLTRYDKVNKKFIHSFGGPLTASGNQLTLKVEFNSSDKSQVGKTQTHEYSISNNILSSTISGSAMQWQRTDNGEGALAGNWRITQRKQGDQMGDIPLRPRRTLKLLTATRFQWAAINIETGEFSGTGGGAYTFAGGKYTEHIEFFSRDNTRVGAALSFDGKIENGNWIHSGLSSKGDPIYEIWSGMK